MEVSEIEIRNTGGIRNTRTIKTGRIDFYFLFFKC